MNVWFLILAAFTLIWTLFARPIIRWKLGIYRKIGMTRFADFFDRIFDPWCMGVTIVSAILTVLFALLGFRVI